MHCKDMHSVREVFKDENIEVSDDDIKELAKIIMMAVKKIDSMKEEELEKIFGGSATSKILNFAHYPVDHTVEFINRHVSNQKAKKVISSASDMANTAIDISLWAGLIYLGYKGCETLYNTAIQKGWISKCN